MRNQAVKPDVPSMLVIYGFSLHLSHFSNNRSGGWGASNKHCALKMLPHRSTPDEALPDFTVTKLSAKESELRSGSEGFTNPKTIYQVLL